MATYLLAYLIASVVIAMAVFWYITLEADEDVEDEKTIQFRERIQLRLREISSIRKVSFAFLLIAVALPLAIFTTGYVLCGLIRPASHS